MSTQNLNPQSGQSCPFCGSSSFIWGIARGHGKRLDFVPGESVFEQLKSLFPRKVEARRCDGCGNLQLFVRE